MSKEHISSIQFDKQQEGLSFFDTVSLSNLLQKTPSDHSQFEHHRITFFALLVITEGEGRHTINFKEYTFEKGTIFALRPGHIHKFYQSEAKGELLLFSDNFALHFMGQQNSGRIFHLFNEHLSSPKLQLDKIQFRRILNSLEFIKREYLYEKDEFSMEMIRSSLHVILTQLVRMKHKAGDVFTQTKYLASFLLFEELVDANCEQNRKVSFYCEKMHVTTRTLNNITHGIAKKSAKMVIIDIVISKIKRLLIDSTYNVSSISFELGFLETSHFFKFFKKHTGQTPKQFRENFR